MCRGSFTSWPWLYRVQSALLLLSTTLPVAGCLNPEVLLDGFGIEYPSANSSMYGLAFRQPRVFTPTLV